MKRTIFSLPKVLHYGYKRSIFTDLSEKIATIRQSTLLKNLSEKEIAFIAQKTVSKLIPTKTVFIIQDDVSTAVYFIIKGSVRVYRLTEEGYEVTIGFCGPGDVIGEMAVISQSPRSANVQSMQEMEVLELSASNFTEILKKNPQMAIHLLQIFSKRIQESNMYREEILGKNLQDRTFDIMQSLSKYFPNNDIFLSQEELATIVGATRARVTEVLNTLALSGKITLSHRRIHIN